MRSFLVLVLAGGLFAGFLIRSHGRAASLRANERRVLGRLRSVARDADRSGRDESGYRFRWVRHPGQPDLLLAGPIRRGKDGVRWFGTLDGISVYAFDTVLFRVPVHGPETGPLQNFLSQPDERRRRTRHPYGWRLVE